MNPQAGKTATTSMLAAKAYDALLQFKIDGRNIYLRELGQKELWMNQQSATDEWQIGSRYWPPELRKILAQTDPHYDAVIADLEARRDQINAMIEMLRQMRTAAGAGPSVSGAVPSMPVTVMGPDIPHDAFFGMTIPEAAKKYLTAVRRTTPHPALCDALLDGGFKTTAANFREVVRSTLGRNSDFVKISGQWGLAEWYGNCGSRKAKRGQGEGQAEPVVVSQPEDVTVELEATEATKDA